VKTHQSVARSVKWIGMAGGIVLALADLTLGASGRAEQGPTGPSYAIPNIVATIMCLVALAIACKDFRKAR